jgi:hypothetical protein
MELNIEAFNAQRWSAYAILFLVVIVVISGISFSGFQLWKSISVAGVQTSNELELSASKVLMDQIKALQAANASLHPSRNCCSYDFPSIFVYLYDAGLPNSYSSTNEFSERAKR